MAEPGSAPSGVLLDLEDVLVPWNSVGHWQWAWRPQGPRLGERHVRSTLRKELRAWDRRRWRGLVGAEPPVDEAGRLAHVRATLQAIAGRSLPAAEADAVVARFDRPAGEIEQFDDVAPGLDRLRAAGRSIGVVTELPEVVARWALRRGGWSSLPLVRHGDDPAGERLPTKRAFRAACTAIGGEAATTVYVGDLFWSDVRAGSRAGLTAYLFDRYERFGGVEVRRVSSLTSAVDLSVSRPEHGDDSGEEADVPSEPGPEVGPSP